MANKTYVRSLIPALTIGLQHQGSRMLYEGELELAERVNPAIIKMLEEGDEEMSKVAELVELDEEQAGATMTTGPVGEAPAVVEPTDDDDDDEPEADDDEPEADGDEPYDPGDHNVVDVLEYLKTVDDPAEVERVKEAEAAGRDSTQVADFEHSKE